MTGASSKISSFLVLDSAMLGGAESFLPMARDARPDWLIPLYKEVAAAVSPWVIDIEAAQQAGQLDLMTALMNAMRPQLHASLIDTALSHAELAQHLRHFIFIRTEAGKELTLRFADCSILPVLALAFNPTQWRTFASPMVRWCVHRRDGTLTVLPPADPEQILLPTPLVLTDQQIDQLKEAAAVDQVIANLQSMLYGEIWSGNSEQQHRWASEARAMWHAAGHTDSAVLFALASAVFETRGRLLEHPGLIDMLTQNDTAAICRQLQQAAIRR